jgi:hypothetical protein
MAVAMLCNALAVPLFMLMLLISSTLRWACFCGAAERCSPASDSLFDSVREVPRKYETNRIVNQPFVSQA